MIIKCTTLEQVKKIVEVEGWVSWQHINYKDCLNYINKFGYVCVKIIYEGEYGNLDSWNECSNNEFVDFVDSKYCNDRRNMNKLHAIIQVDVNTKKVREAIESIKEFDREVKIKDAVTLLQSLGYKVEAPYQEPTDEEICARILTENKKINYVPDWSSASEKYQVTLDTDRSTYRVASRIYTKDIGVTYTTKEIATQIVVELNEKRFEKEI